LDILRLLLALRYNGLETGIYTPVAMLNHLTNPIVQVSSEADKYSEVRTTRAVRQEESLTISATILSRHQAQHLWEQHRFDIGADLLWFT
jgi:hypothetical protein